MNKPKQAAHHWSVNEFQAKQLRLMSRGKGHVLIGMEPESSATFPEGEIARIKEEVHKKLLEGLAANGDVAAVQRLAENARVVGEQHVRAEALNKAAVQKRRDLLTAPAHEGTVELYRECDAAERELIEVGKVFTAVNRELAQGQRRAKLALRQAVETLFTAQRERLVQLVAQRTEELCAAAGPALTALSESLWALSWASGDADRLALDFRSVLEEARPTVPPTLAPEEAPPAAAALEEVRVKVPTSQADKYGAKTPDFGNRIFPTTQVEFTDERIGD